MNVFKEFYHAQIVVKRLIDAVVTLKDLSRLKSPLKRVLGGAETWKTHRSPPNERATDFNAVLLIASQVSSSCWNEPEGQ